MTEVASQHDKKSQESINAVWSSVWDVQLTHGKSKGFFKDRYFLESYPRFKQYLPQEVRSILDVGAGTGRYGLQFARDFPQAQVVLSDIVDESLTLMEKTRQDLDLENVVVQKEDIYKLSFGEGTFDVVFCGAVIMHVTDPDRMLAELARVVKPGGVVILSSVNSWNGIYMSEKIIRDTLRKPAFGFEKEYSQIQLGRLIKKAGLEVVARDGYYCAYAIYRWRRKFLSGFFVTLSRVVNRLTKALDAVSGRCFSRFFGFEVFVVATKRL